MTKNFQLNEFLESRFFSEEQQKKVIADFEKNKKELLPKLQKLANNLQVLRDDLNASVSINIAYRPKWYELLKGRSGNSKHCLCEACDITADGYTPLQVRSKIEELIKSGKMDQGGLGKYNSFTHYDIRGVKARW
jgi:uncharacterized protein YcbK (DUF882 family)|tara:strand:- start:1343 stop:1747 length:405 start_codon:yes stop_codon:yes gene_type:complete